MSIIHPGCCEAGCEQEASLLGPRVLFGCAAVFLVCSMLAAMYENTHKTA